MLMPSTCTARLMRAYTSTLYTSQVSHKTYLTCNVLEPKCGGLLFDRHKTPLTRRFVVYYCSAVYITLSPGNSLLHASDYPAAHARIGVALFDLLHFSLAVD